MKKLFFAIIFFILSAASSAYAASQEYDKILGNRISELGIYDGSSGIAYASIEHFSENRDTLFIAYVSDDALNCEIYSDIDGIQQTDFLSFSCGNSEDRRLSLAHRNNESYVIMTTSDATSEISEFYTVIDDSFKTISPPKYDGITPVIGYENQRITLYDNDVNSIYSFFNSLKLAKINSMKLNNRVDIISEEERENILALLSACADIMKYDSRNYDYDTLMKYLLCTHQNFAGLIGMDPQSAQAQDIPGFEDISIVSGDYIDNILTTVFKIEPEHPSINELINRGYCYSGGLYYYKNIFSVDFHTDIHDLNAVYYLGGNIYYVIFTDTYYENGTSTPEYSFAIIRTSDTLPYSLIRIGMGENLLSESEAVQYSPQKTYEQPNWKTPPPGYVVPETPYSMPILLIVISIGSVMLIIGSIIIIREIRKR